MPSPSFIERYNYLADNYRNPNEILTFLRESMEEIRTEINDIQVQIDELTEEINERWENDPLRQEWIDVNKLINEKIVWEKRGKSVYNIYCKLTDYFVLIQHLSNDNLNMINETITNFSDYFPS